MDIKFLNMESNMHSNVPMYNVQFVSENNCAEEGLIPNWQRFDYDAYNV